MDKINIDQVRQTFYNDLEMTKPNWKLMQNIKEVAKNVGYAIPSNKDSQQVFYNKLRQSVYAVQDYEWRKNGRILVGIKYAKGELVVYGLSKRKVHLIADGLRRKRRIEKQTNDYNEKITYTINKYPETAMQLELGIDTNKEIQN